jgi:hypothetical protein
MWKEAGIAYSKQSSVCLERREAGKKPRNVTITIFGLRADISNLDFRNTKQECYPPGGDV